MKKLLHLVLLMALPALSFAGPGSLQFIPNLGQWNDPSLYKVESGNATIYLENGRFTYLLSDPTNGDKVHEYKHDKSVQPILRYHAYRMIFQGANMQAETKGADPIVTYYNYYLGNDQSRWKAGIHPFTSVSYKSLYNGVDLLLRSDNGSFAYDLIVAPNADVAQIKLQFEGADKLELVDGKLLIHNSIQTVEESAPYTYQLVNGEKKEVKSEYVLDGNTLSFAFPEGYDKNIPLIIDPTVVFATFSGSTSSNYGFSATYDAAGNAYGAGEVFGPQYPVTVGAFQTVWGGGGVDINVSKYNPDGTVHIYGTYLGGNDYDQPHSMVVDANNNLIVTGISSSSNYPVTTGCYDGTHNGGSDLIVSKLSTLGTALLASTYVGGTGADGGNASPLSANYGDAFKGEVICDATGNIYVAGNTKSSNFPTANATQSALSGTMDAVAFKLNPSMTNLLWSTYLGGSGTDNAVVIALSNTGSNIYISGGTTSNNMPSTPGAYQTAFQGGSADGYIARFMNSGAYPLLSCTYTGTSSYDNGYGVQVDKNNGVYTMGQTNSGSFPIIGTVYSNAGSGHYIMRFDSTLNNVQFSTVFGNGQASQLFAPNAFMVDSCLNIYFSGFGSAANMPTTNNAFQTSVAGGQDFYFIALGPNAANLLFGTYYGSTSDEHVDGGTSRFDNSGIIYQGICTNAPSFPGSSGTVFPNNASSWNVVTLKIAFELGIVNAIASSNNAQGCGPLTVQFQNTSQNATSYLWDFGDGSPTTTVQNPTHTFTDPGTYTVMLAAASTFACNVNDTIYLTVIVDSGGVISDFTYQIVDSCGPYTATFTNTSTTFSPGATFSWNFGDNTSFNGPNPPLHNYPGVGSYTVTLIVHDTGAVCNEWDTVSYTLGFTTFDVAVNATLSPDDRGCAPLTIQFQPGGTNVNTYFWDFGDGSPASNQQSPSYTYTQGGVYTVTFIGSNNSPSACKNADTGYLTITVDTGHIAADFEVVVTDSCDEFNVEITNTSPQVTPTTVFNWYFGDGTSFTGQTPGTHFYPSTGTYTITLIITDSTTCNTIDSISKTITISNFKVVADLPVLPDVCAINDIFFTHQSQNATSVLWTLGDGNTSTENSFTHHYAATGQYQITFIAINPLACNGSDTMTGLVKIGKQAIADFYYTPETPIENEPLSFTNMSQFADTYLWNFGDGTGSDEVNPVHMFPKTGTFQVCLTANNRENCPDTVCKAAYSDVKALIDIPTGFSPNGDGMNDILYVRGIGVETVNLKIFNRWGKLVFESNSMDHGWDGKLNGKEQEMEAYAYVLYATFIDGQTYQSQGNITLIR